MQSSIVSTGSSSCQTSIERENGRRLVNDGEFVVGGEWHEGDGDLRNHVTIGPETVAQPIKVGQIAERILRARFDEPAKPRRE
jgi:hypothetical protein